MKYLLSGNIFKRHFTYSFMLIIGLIFLMCCQKEEENTMKYFDVRKMKVYSIEKGDVITYNNYGSLYDNYEYSYDNFSLVLDFRDSIYYYSENSNWAINFINSAYATHVCHGFCLNNNNDGYLGSEEIILGIYITSDSDFDSLHLAGDTLNEYFKVSYVLDSIDYKSQRYILFDLVKAPELNSTHTFHIEYLQTNGEFYMGETTIKIKQ